MTNVGMVQDAPGFLETLRSLCDETGTLLVFDETHSISVMAAMRARTARWRI